MFFTSMLLSLFFHSTTPAQPVVSGYWIGEITQEEGGYRSNYDLEMHLTEVDGTVKGRSYVKVDDIYAEMQVAGNFANGVVLTIKDTEINENRIKPGMEWCLKSYILLLKKKDNEWILEGHWHGKTTFSTCTPGKVILKRGVYRV